MSRDWRPFEQYKADIYAKNVRGESLRDVEFVWVQEGKPDLPMGNAEVKAAYPELYFFFSRIESFYEKYSNDKEARLVLNQFENALLKVEEEFSDALDFGDGTPDTWARSQQLWKLDEEELLKLPVETVVQEWFFGRLVPTFYYNEDNNSVFSRFISNKIEEAKSLTKNKENVYEDR